jgi:hypothetical protein
MTTLPRPAHLNRQLLFAKGVAAAHHNCPDSVPIWHEGDPARTRGGILGKGGDHHHSGSRLSDTLPKCAMGSASEPAGPVAFRATSAIAPKPIFSEPNKWIGD